VETFVILRRGVWKTPQQLRVVAAREPRASAFFESQGRRVKQSLPGSTRVGDGKMPQHVRWIRSYVIEGEDGKLGTACIYQASSAQAIREHARRAELQAEIFMVREDPNGEAAALSGPKNLKLQTRADRRRGSSAPRDGSRR
jgi:hypothetical protein